MFFSNSNLATEWEPKNLGSLATKSQMLPDQVKKDATCIFSLTSRTKCTSYKIPMQQNDIDIAAALSCIQKSNMVQHGSAATAYWAQSIETESVRTPIFFSGILFSWCQGAKNQAHWMERNRGNRRSAAWRFRTPTSSKKMKHWSAKTNMQRYLILRDSKQYVNIHVWSYMNRTCKTTCKKHSVAYEWVQCVFGHLFGHFWRSSENPTTTYYLTPSAAQGQMAKIYDAAKGHHHANSHHCSSKQNDQNGGDSWIFSKTSWHILTLWTCGVLIWHAISWRNETRVISIHFMSWLFTIRKWEGGLAPVPNSSRDPFWSSFWRGVRSMQKEREKHNMQNRTLNSNLTSNLHLQLRFWWSSSSSWLWTGASHHLWLVWCSFLFGFFGFFGFLTFSLRLSPSRAAPVLPCTFVCLRHFRGLAGLHVTLAHKNLYCIVSSYHLSIRVCV